MAATIHAIWLLALPVVTVAVCLVAPRKTWTADSVLSAILAVLLAAVPAFLVLETSAHQCYSGEPVTQPIIAGCCIWLILTFPRNAWIRGVGTVILIASMAGLSNQYLSLVHTKGLVGNAIEANLWRKDGAQRLTTIRAHVRDAAEAGGQPYAAGWVREMLFAGEVRHDLDGAMPIRVVVTSLWHSWYSRLFANHVVRQDFWFPGGLLPADADFIVLKDAP